MKEFIFAFPLPVGIQDAPSFLEKVSIRETSGIVLVPGCSLMLEVFLRDPVKELVEIFNESQTLEKEESEVLKSHKSLFFLRGALRDFSSLQEVNNLVKKMIEAGAFGVYAEHSGIAVSKKNFLEIDLNEDPLECWLNFLESKNVIYSLGMESFSLPDLCVSKENGTEEDLRDLLLATAEYLYSERIPATSGTKVEGFEETTFELRQELKPFFSKESPEWNRLGTFRLVKR